MRFDICSPISCVLIFAMAWLAGCQAPTASPVTATPPTGSVTDFTISVPAAGNTSVAVYDRDGTLLRTLLTGARLEAGRHRLSWDGLDRFGRPAAPGSYEWRQLWTPGFQAEYLLSVGNKRPDGQWREWIGNHGPLHSVACDGEWGFAGGMGENVPGSGLFHLRTGEVRWLAGNRVGWGTVTGAAMVEHEGTPLVLNLLSNQTSSQVLAIQLADGKVYGRPVDVLLTEDGDQRWAGTKYGFAATDEGFVVSSAKHGVVREWPLDVFAREKGAKAEPRKIVKAPSPEQLAMAGETAYVLSGGGVYVLNPEGERRQLIPAGTLARPQGFCFQAPDSLLIGVHGEARQVQRFDAATGQLKAAYGRPGGRQWGPYDPRHFRDIQALCGDGAGGFLVVEGKRSVRRVAHFDAAGKFVQEWPTGQQFFNFATFDPADPRVIIYRPDPGIKGIAECDYESGTWKLTYELRHDQFDSQLFPSAGHYSTNWRAIRRNGKLYLWCDSGPRQGIVRVDAEEGRLVPLVAAGHSHGLKEAAGGPYFQALAVAGKSQREAPNFIWSDRDRDGRISGGEVTVGNFLGDSGGTTCYVDADLNLYRPATGEEPGTVVVVRNLTPEQDRPTWGIAGVERRPAEAHPEFTEYGSGACTGLRVEPDGTVYRVDYAKGHGHDRPNDGWPTLRQGTQRFRKYRPDGSLEWNVARAASRSPGNLANPSDRDQFHDDVGIIGQVHDTIIVADRVVTPAAAWTPDGLYAGSFFDRRVDDGLPGEVYHWWRDPLTEDDGPVPYDLKTKGSVIEVPDGAIWAPMGEQNSPIYRVTGWDGWQRRRGTLRVAETPPHAAFDGSGLRAEYFAGPELAGEPVATLVEEQLWHDWPDRGRHHGTWRNGIPGDLQPEQPFSVRWTGTLTPHLSERFVFAAINRSTSSPTTSERWHDDWGGVRIWLGGRLILDNWQGKRPRGHRPESEPIPLLAGQRYALRIEYAWRGTEAEGAHPEFSLLWESATQERQRPPMALLHPEALVLPRVHFEATGDLSEVSPREAGFVAVRDEAAANGLAVGLEVAGGATRDDVLALPRVLLIPPGQTRSAPFVVRAVDDSLIEAAERFGLALAIRPTYVGDGTTTAVTVPLFDDEAGPTEGLTARFSFDDAGPSPRIRNRVVGAPPGQVGAAVAETSDEGLSGRALRLREGGSGRWRITAKDERLQVPYTLSLWFRAEGEDTGLIRVWRHGRYEVGLFVREGKLIGGNNRYQTDPGEADATVSPGRWHHAALVVHGKSWEAYLDGRSVGTSQGYYAGPPLDAQLGFGPEINYKCTRPEAVAYPLLLDEVCYYQRALSPDELRSLAVPPRR